MTVTTPVERVERVLTPAEVYCWQRRPELMRSANPVTQWLCHLVEGADEISVTCPLCRCRGRVASVLDHALWYHRLTFSEAAAWLEDIDADLFALAVHYLMSKDRAARRA
jgi:hypothetical protein